MGKKTVKCGYLTYYHKRVFGKDWQPKFCILKEDSTFKWYKKRTKDSAEGKIKLIEVAHLLAIGPYTERVPKRPDVPSKCSSNNLIAFGSKKKNQVHWFLCSDENDLKSWMDAIISTLPPPPHATSPQQAPVDPTLPGDPPPPYSPPNSQTGSYPSQPSHPSQHGNNQTAIIVRDHESGDNFATGMLLGMGVGSSWNWGMGIGWNCGGSGWDHMNMINHHDVHSIINTTNVTNNQVINNTNVENTANMSDDDDDNDFDDDDEFDGDDYDDDGGDDFDNDLDGDFDDGGFDMGGFDF